MFLHVFIVLMKKENEFLKENTMEEESRFGRRTSCSAAEHGALAEAPLAPEGGLASHL